MTDLDSLSEHDRTVLRANVADKIDQLVPLARAGLPWRATFAAQAATLSRLVSDDEDRAWAIAHAFVLREVPA